MKAKGPIAIILAKISKTVAENGNVTIKWLRILRPTVLLPKTVTADTVNTDKVKVGKNGQDGVSITGPDAANGTDGKVAVTGKDGKDAVSMSGKDGVGHIGLTGKDGSNADITADKGRLRSRRQCNHSY